MYAQNSSVDIAPMSKSLRSVCSFKTLTPDTKPSRLLKNAS
jgi:hypothetical protein